MILVGDVREKLRDLEAESVQCVVTSPPYWGLRDYGQKGQLGLEPTPEEYVAHMAVVFREVRRVLRADGTLWLNLGDSYAANRGDGSSSVGPKQATNVGANLGRLVAPPGLKAKDLVGIPWMVAFALRADGWYLRSDIIWAKPNPMPESVTDRPTKAHEYLFLLSKSGSYFYDQTAIWEQFTDKPVGWLVSGSGVTTYGLDGQHRPGTDGKPSSTLGGRPEPAGRNKRSVWTIATQPYPEAHFATFPEALVAPCILAGSRPEDQVLDPFAGSGTTLVVAKRLGREGIGIELNPDYIRLAERRIALTTHQPPLLEVSV